jgi:hypothetical protein
MGNKRTKTLTGYNEVNSATIKKFLIVQADDGKYKDHFADVCNMVVDNHFRDVTKMGVENICGVIYGR